MNYGRNALMGSVSALSLFRERPFGPQRGLPVFAPEGTADPSPEPEPEPAPEPDPKPEPEKSKTSDEAAKLLKEVMKLKAEKAKLADSLKKFDGIDLDKVGKLVADADAAEAARQKAEEDRLKAAGDWEQLKARIVDEHKRETQVLRDALKGKEIDLGKLTTTIKTLTVGTAFAQSSFIKDGTVLTPNKAMRLYEDHFETDDDGRVLAYDAPRGSSSRTPLVNGSGEPLAFDEAMRRIIDADPEKDHVLRSQRRSGAGSGGQSGSQAGAKPVDDKLGGTDRIAAALKAGALKGPQSVLKR